MAIVLAHRGSSAAYPENTMLAFEKALEEGAHGIETDVHLSSDGEVMIIHDESLLRTAGLDEMVFNLKRSELEKISAGKTLNDEFGFTPIPSLDEFLTLMEKYPDRLFNIEMKTAPVYYPGIEEKVVALVAKHGLEKNVIYSSFNWLSIWRLEQLVPQCMTGLLFSGLKLYNQSAIMRTLNIECFHPDFNDIDQAFVDAMHRDGRIVNAWTVNEEEDIRRMIDYGVDGIITNYPSRALALLAK